MLIEEDIIVNAPIETVWHTFIDLTRWADWSSVLKDISFDGDVIQKGCSFRCCVSPYVFPIYFEPKVEEVVQLEKIVWTGEKLGITSKHEFIFQRSGISTEIISRETFSGIPVNLAGPFFPVGRLRELNAAFLGDLKAASEQAGGCQKHE